MKNGKQAEFLYKSEKRKASDGIYYIKQIKTKT